MNKTKKEELRKKLFNAIVTRKDSFAIQHDHGYERIFTKITEEKFLNENHTEAIYQVDTNGFTKSGVIDVDLDKKENFEDYKEKLQNQTSQIYSVLKDEGFSPLIEFSGRRGYHVWIIFSKPVQAWRVRQKLKSLQKHFPTVDINNIEWEIFPKQDSVTKENPGNAIKLPMQIHKFSGKESRILDTDFEPYYPDHLPLNTPDLLPKTKKTIMAVSKPSKNKDFTNSPPKSGLKRVFKNCKELQRIKNEVLLEGSTGHADRLFLASQLKPFGEAGRKKLHEILSKLPDYDEAKTDYHFDSLDKRPQTCNYHCGDKKCESIKKVGGNSPLKFAYQKRIFPYLGQNTGSYAYYDFDRNKRYILSSKQKLKEVVENASQEFDGIEGVYEEIFDPHSFKVINEGEETINLFTPTNYMLLKKNNQTLNPKQDFPSINRLLTNLIPDSSDRDRFLNWLAGILQTRDKKQTAWVFTGDPGAGKNVFLRHVLKPLLGSSQARKVENNDLHGSFNGWLRGTLLIAFNEVSYDEKSRSKLNSKLKAIITDTEMLINEKFVNRYPIKNYANCLFFSNEKVPVSVEDKDRRFNIVRTKGDLRQNSWFKDPEQFFKDLKKELGLFAQFLINYDYDSYLANTVIENDLKSQMITASMNNFEEFATHLKNNDTDWFNNNIQADDTKDRLNDEDLSKGRIRKKVALEVFSNIYQDYITSHKLSKELKLYGIKLRQKRIKGKSREYCYVWNT